MQGSGIPIPTAKERGAYYSPLAGIDNAGSDMTSRRYRGQCKDTFQFGYALHLLTYCRSGLTGVVGRLLFRWVYASCLNFYEPPLHLFTPIGDSDSRLYR